MRGGGKRHNGPGAPSAVFRAAAAALCAFSIAFGNQWRVSDVRFEGNRAIPTKQLLEAMDTKTSHFWSASFFSQSKTLADIQTLTEVYRRNGYLDAVVTLLSVERDTANRAVSITIGIVEGAQTLVEDVSISGVSALSDSAARAIIQTREGGPHSRWTADNDAQLLIDSLGGRGYLYARVEDCVAIDTVRHRGTVMFTIDQGPLVIVGAIDVAGERKVLPKVVLGELEFETGAILTSKDIRASIERLYRTGLFSLVVIEPALENLTESERRLATIAEPVTVGVREARFFSIDAAVGYQSYERFRGSMLVRYGNLFGLGHAVSFDGGVNRLQQSARVTYSFPSLFSIPVYVDISPYIEHHNVTYLGLFDGVLVSVGREIDWNLTFRVFARFERVEYLHNLSSADAVPSRTNTQSVGGDIVYDSRKGIRDTAAGVYSRFSPEFAGLGGSGTNQYYRSLADVRGYCNPVRWLGFSSAVNIGYARGFGKGGPGVPAQALYYPGVGGMRLVRGFANDSLGKQGGRLTLIVNPIEVRFPIYKWIGGIAFIDCGYLWNNPPDARFRDLRWTAGPGIFLRGPFGQVELDWGYRLNVTPGWGSPYFSIGRAF